MAELKNNTMKKDVTIYDFESIESTREKYERLVLFQLLLRENEVLSQRYHGKAGEIADGLEPWINALEITLSD